MITIEKISNDLGLKNTSDWGIINDNPDRVKEFISYYNSHSHLFDLGIKINFTELIISSMNEAILENKRDNELDFFFREYIYEHLDDKFILINVIGYWMSIADEEEFPVGFLLDQIVPKDM
tara:strand:+ start:173 stop:535 length:363 start_codon:yes stop_codon:yes gene_type:complete